MAPEGTEGAKVVSAPGALDVFPPASTEATAEEKLLTSLNEIALEMMAKLDDGLEQEWRRPPSPHTEWTWASEIGHPCLKNLVHSRRDWEQKQPLNANALWRIIEGIEYERKIRSRLASIGFELTQNQARFAWDEYKISGRIDGLAPLNRTLPAPYAGQKTIPAEIKFLNQQAFDRVQTIDDVRQHRGWWIRKYPSQLNLYMLMGNAPAGFMILGSAQRRPKILPMLVDYDLGEHDLQKAAAANKHMAEGTTPEPIPFDASVCGMCNFNHICQPLKASSSTIELGPSDTIELELFLDAQKEYDAARVDFERYKKALIGDKKKPGKFYGHTGYVNDIEIKSRTVDRKGYEVAPTSYIVTEINRVGE